MEALHHLMIAVDHTEMDRTLLEYTSILAKMIPLQKVSIVHVEVDTDEEGVALLEDLQLPSSSQQEFDTWMEDIAQNLQVADEVEVETYLLDGSPLHALLSFARDHNVDMILVGAKTSEEGTGILSARLARKAPCSVMYVPAHPPQQLQTVMLPTDFSDYSAMAFQEMRYIKKHFPEVNILTEHVYRLPLGYYKTGKSKEEFEQIMEENAKKRFKQFVKAHDLESLQMEPLFVLDDDKNPADKIIAVAREKKVDLLIICAKGHTRASSILLGSTTEKILRLDKKIPVMILKEKGETLGLLDILLNI